MSGASISLAVTLDAAEVARRLANPARLPAGNTAPAGKASAVLVPVVLHPVPTLLLTLRAAALSSHAGQVAFPGGRMDPGETPEQTALREAAEEIGLDPRLPRVTGRLPELVTGTGYHITPVLALLEPPLNLTPAPDEVELAFEYELASLLDPALPETRTAIWKGERRSFAVWPHARHYIWGATAAIMHSLAALLRDGS
ncbi:NUDIX hydrolase [Teichococcus oryzae]|uniref:CoA pyrophosphatase n=1 Tax=Teichococcus oryzae TaxID=1608942 RepID=A0A5B2TH65_9PROT|nr:CoA pyrophosphatase [Pseudoroseomonas oryzae]KAA2213444.1 CoA pyrophosphatase [Pseudoroseomonas oryzae]